MELDLAPRPAGMELDLAPRPAGMELDLAPQPVDLAPPPPEPPARARIAPADAPKLAADITQPSFAPEVEHEPGAFDLAAELSVAIGRDEPGLGTLAGTEEEGFEQVFEAFKSGIERELGDGDHEARYDLGIAYKEMGLLEDALAAFQIAMYAPARQLACLHMMGLCALELGRAADAVGHLEQALSLPDLPSDQRVPLRYDVGRAYAALGDKARARAAFEEVRAADPGFGEIERELAALEAGGETEASEEAYESFDDLISEGPAMATPTARYESFDDLFAEESASPSQASEELVSPSLAAVDLAEPEPDASADPQPEAEDAAPDETVGVEPPASPPPPTPARRRSKISFV